MCDPDSAIPLIFSAKAIASRAGVSIKNAYTNRTIFVLPASKELNLN